MTDNQITQEQIMQATMDYFLTYYIDRMANNMNLNKHQVNNHVLFHLRNSMYQVLLDAIKTHQLSIDGLQQQLAEWKTIRKIKDIPLLLPNADIDALTKDDLQNVRQLVSELDKAVGLFTTDITKVLNKCNTLVDKQEPTQEVR